MIPYTSYWSVIVESPIGCEYDFLTTVPPNLDLIIRIRTNNLR